jgi:hypothetical protein
VTRARGLVSWLHQREIIRNEGRVGVAQSKAVSASLPREPAHILGAILSRQKSPALGPGFTPSLRMVCTTLHDDINELVEQRLRRALETGETVNVPDLALEMAESLADLVVCGAPLEEQPRLIAHIVDLAGSLQRSARLVWVRSDSSFGDVSKHQQLSICTPRSPITLSH